MEEPSPAPADHENEQTPLLQNFQDRQFHVLSHKQLLVVFPALALVQFTSFLDQTAISTALPAIADSLHIGSSISWVGASFLVTSTSVQLINGRLSDIFGRKTCLITALTVMALGNVASGFSDTPSELYATRAFSGFGAGAINALVQIAVSDYTTLEQRGYYFGIIGVATALGNGLGPVVGGALTEQTSWRWTFWFIGPLAGVAVLHLAFALPKSGASTRGIWKQLQMMDWLGILTSMVSIILILIPLSQGGSAISWTSPTVIVMLPTGVCIFLVFLVIEWRFVKLPLLPLHLFQYGLSTNILLAMNIIIGWVFWANLFYIPLYFQNVRGWSPATAGSLILPMVIAHGATSALSGILVAATGRYTRIISGGAALWTIGAIGKTLYGQTTPVWSFFMVGIFEGFGVGCSLQPVLVGLLAGSQNSDRAVLTGLRNFIRDIGGAMGITISGTILNNVLYRGLKGKLSPELISQLTSSAFALRSIDLSDDDKHLVSTVYMRGVQAVFVSYAVLITVYFLCSLFLEDYGLGGKYAQVKSSVTTNPETEEY
ncbi:hypothetical protein CNMCM7691_005725 [Aspergillus felis]|uniref:Major facilitator superfamily (MFS) profile domain-containing protein n=1 Tax=Aspergillus felis TaxID=1287682 RepID=A0A8H6QT69_9EURO|nr:hypothetical protein CNMCM7691_005725 [Aspergillus felis]